MIEIKDYQEKAILKLKEQINEYEKNIKKLNKIIKTCDDDGKQPKSKTD